MIKKSETYGITMALIGAFLWGMQPLIVVEGTKMIPPITFAALATITAGLFFSILTLATKSIFSIKNKKTWKPLLGISVFIIVIPYALFFSGAAISSSTNASVLSLSEIIFTLIFTHFLGEKTTSLKVTGALSIFVGGFILLGANFREIGLGEILIICSGIAYPIGNFYSKKALHYMSGTAIVAIRSLIGGALLLSIAYILEPSVSWRIVLQEELIIIVVTGIFMMGISKVIWYECLKYLDISKAVSLVMTFPLFSMLGIVILDIEPTYTHTWIGFAITMIGVYLSIKRKSVPAEQTLYKR